MPITLPTDEDDKLRPFTAAEYLAMDIRRRGVTSNGDHIAYDFGPDGSGCTRRFSCAWEHRFNAVIYFTGAVVSYFDGSGVRRLSRLPPQRDPDIPKWICTKCHIVGHRFQGAITPTGESVGEEDAPTMEAIPSFHRADLECTYELVPYDVATDGDAETAAPDREYTRYITWPGYVGAEMRADTSYISMPGSILQFVTNTGTGVPAGTKIPHGVGFTEGTTDFKIVWRRLPFEVWGAGSTLFQLVIGTETTRGYIGAVNKTAFRGYPALSLQLRGVEQRLLPDPNGLGHSWELAYLFNQKVVPYGQLGFYHHDVPGTPPGNPGTASGYYMVLRPSAGQTTITAGSLTDTDSLFPVRDFANLFKVGIA